MAEHAEQRLDGDDGLLGLGAGAGDRPHQPGGGTPRPRPRPRLLAGHGGGAAAGRGSRILHLAHAELSAQEVQIKYVNTLCSKEGVKCPSIPFSLRRSPLLLAAAALQLRVHRGDSGAQVQYIYPVQYNILNIYPYLHYPQYLPLVSRIQTLVDSIVAGESGTRARHYSRHMGTAGHAVY